MSDVNIVHFVENLERGGLERMVVDLAIAQQGAGHTMQVVCLFGAGVLAPELLARGIPVHACDKRGGLDLRAVRRARELLRAAPDAVLHTHNDMAHYYATLASVGLPLQRVLNTRHSMGDSKDSGRKQWLYQRAIRRADYAVAVCEAARRKLANEGVRPRGRLLSIPNGIDAMRFAPVSAEAHRALANELGVAPETRLVGTVGRLNRVKDQATLIRAYRETRTSCPETALVLVGGGALREELEAVAVSEGVRDVVHFLGDRNDVRRLLPGMDLFVLSSLSEGYSMALLEACASALPIVATDVGGNGEIVRDGINGRLVPAGHPSALAAALIGLLSLPRERLTAMGHAGRDWVLNEGSFELMAQRYARLYAGD